MKKIKYIYHYLSHFFKAGNEASSPFVNELLTDVINVKANYIPYKKIEQLRELLLGSKAKINCTDLGAGADNTSEKTISSIARNSIKSAKEAQLLFRLANHFQPQQIIELGTSLGISTAYLASSNTKTKVVTIEGCSEIAELARQNFKHLKLKNIEQKVGNIDTVLPKVLDSLSKIDFVFFDGNHRKAATINYFNICLRKANESTVFIFDDIYWSAEMMEAWTEIKNNNRVTVTIDLFCMGLVFFRKEEAKQDFLIRF